MGPQRAAPVTPQQIVLRGVAVAAVSLTATAVVTGILVLTLSGVSLPDGALGLRILLFFVLIGAGVLTVVVAGVLAARWWRLPRPVLVGVGGPLAAVALAPVLSVPMRLIDPGGEWDSMSVGEFDGPWFLTVVVAVAAGDAVVAWAASGRGVRLVGTTLTLVALMIGAALADGPLKGRTLVDNYATLDVPLLVPDTADHLVTSARPEIQNPDDVSPFWGVRQRTVGVLVTETSAVRVRVEPLPAADLSCANLFEWSVRPGLEYSTQSDTCEQLSRDRWLVTDGDTRRPIELVALRPDALVAVRLRDPWARDPADGVALMYRAVESLVPTSAERLADLPLG